MQLFLLGYILIDICEIFTVGGFPLKDSVRIVSMQKKTVKRAAVLTDAQGFTGAHLGLITATTWILMINGAVGYQLIDDGTALSIGLTLVSAALLFIGTGYIALDTGFSWTGFFNGDITDPDRSYALYTLYLLAPLVFLAIYFLLATILVLKVLGETRPLSMFFEIMLGEDHTNHSCSMARRCCTLVRHRTGLRLRHQHTYMSRHERQDRRRVVRNALHPTRSSDGLDVLVKHYGR